MATKGVAGPASTAGGPLAQANRVRLKRTAALAEARRQVAEAVPEIAGALVLGAKKGSISHLKLLVELGGLDKRSLAPQVRKRKGRGLEQMLIAEWRKESGTSDTGDKE